MVQGFLRWFDVRSEFHFRYWLDRNTVMLFLTAVYFRLCSGDVAQNSTN